MNRLILLAFLATLLVLAALGAEQEEQQSSLDRLPIQRARPGKGSAEKNKKKQKSKRKQKRNGRKLTDRKGKKGDNGTKKSKKSKSKKNQKSRSNKNKKQNNRQSRMNTWSTETLAAKAKSLTANSAGLTAAKDTSTSLTSRRAVNGRSARAAATTCAEVIAANTKLVTLTDQNPSSPKIATVANDVTGITLTTACSDAEKTSLTSQVLKLDECIASVSAELATVQADLERKTHN